MAGKFKMPSIQDIEKVNEEIFKIKEHEIKAKEINNITKIFEILDTLPFQTNEIGILYKQIIFDIDSDEYRNLSPSLYFDIYDISYYKRVLERLKASF